MDDKIVLICFECKRTIVDNEKPENEDEAGDKGKRDRDDEEEWGRIPIPQSDDSEDDTCFDDGTGSNQENGNTSTPQTSSSKTEDKGECRNSLNSDNLAFLVGPRKDGIIRRTDGTLITL
jgi:hypothetical protein